MEPKSAAECRRRVAEIVADAVVERDAERRQALLVMADHWGELLRLRRARIEQPKFAARESRW
jgi:hypothetical protein